MRTIYFDELAADMSGLNVQQLKNHLEKRGLAVSGTKVVLEERLKSALKADRELMMKLEGAGEGAGEGGSSSGAVGTSTNKRKHSETASVPSPASVEPDKKSITQQLECPVCMDLIVPPIYQCEVDR